MFLRLPAPGDGHLSSSQAGTSAELPISPIQGRDSTDWSEADYCASHETSSRHCTCPGQRRVDERAPRQGRSRSAHSSCVTRRNNQIWRSRTGREVRATRNLSRVWSGLGQRLPEDHGAFRQAGRGNQAAWRRHQQPHFSGTGDRAPQSRTTCRNSPA